VVGSVNVDLVVEVASRPEAGETVTGSDLVTLPGGKGANQAIAAARLGGSVALLGRIGDDTPGKLALAALVAAGVDCADLATVAGTATGVALITLTPNGDNAIVVSPGANRALTPADVEATADRLRRAAVVTLQLELPFPTVSRAAELAAMAGVRVVLNLAPARQVPTTLMCLLDPLVVNEHEAAALLDFSGASGGTGSTLVVLAQRLRELGPRSAVITLGGAGAAFAGHDAAGIVPAPRVPALDTTGTGDAFVGALSLALARGHDLDAACRYGVRAGSFAVRGKGAQTSFPDAEDVPIPRGLTRR